MYTINNIVQQANSVVSKQEGGLVISRCRGTVQFYHYHDNRKRDYIKKTDETLLKSLAQKKYCEQVLKISKDLLEYEKMQQKMKDRNIEKIFEQLDPVIKEYVSPFVIPIEMKVQKWAMEPYLSNTKYPEKKKYKTDKGEFVRSKSEVIIANKLFNKNIPYRYECELKFKNNVTLYPDFTIMNPKTGKIIILEHFGLMDNPEYAESFVVKIRLYAKNNYIVGKNLLFTMETGINPFDSDYLDILLEEYF